MNHAIRVALRSGYPLLGLMHDAVEDGWWPSWLAWSGLDAITRRQGEVYADYIERVSKHQAARAVKLADLNDNLTRNGGPPASLRKRYVRARRRLMEVET